MKTRQLSVFLENKPGQLTEPCQALADAGVNIVTLSLADRFDVVLDSGRRIASALSSATIFAEVRSAGHRLLRGERSLIIRADRSGSDWQFSQMADESDQTFNPAIARRAVAIVPGYTYVPRHRRRHKDVTYNDDLAVGLDGQVQAFVCRRGEIRGNLACRTEVGVKITIGGKSRGRDSRVQNDRQ